MTPARRPALLTGALAVFLFAAACASARAPEAGTEPLPPRRDEEYDVSRERRERDTPSRDREGAAYPAGWGRRSDAPRVRVWIDGNDSPFRSGDRVRALFRVDENAYVTVVRVDTDGRMRVLYPRSPYESGWVRGAHSYRVPGSSGGTFAVDDPTGLGYVFAISSYEPFAFSRISEGRAWDHHAIGLQVTGDPFLAVRRFADRIAYDDQTGYATAYDEYYVERRVDYPRYACYDCHGAGRYPVHDPYDHPCPRYRVVVYHDPYYYPYRYYPGTRVVYAARPRYEFKPATSGSQIPGGPRSGAAAGGPLVEHRRRTEDVDLRRPGSPTTDPNLSTGTASGAGATRPGDDVQPSSVGGRRRMDDAASAPVAAPRDGLRTPRRDVEPEDGTGTLHGGGSAGGGSPPPATTPDNGDDRRGGGPRRDPPGQSRDDGRRGPPPVPSRNDEERRDEPRGDEPRGDERRADPPRRDETPVDRGAENRREDRSPTDRRGPPPAERRSELFADDQPRPRPPSGAGRTERPAARPAEPRRTEPARGKAPSAERHRDEAPGSEGRKSPDKRDERRPAETRRRTK